MEKIYQKHDTQHVAATMLYVPHTDSVVQRRFYYDIELTKGVKQKELFELFFNGRCIVMEVGGNVNGATYSLLSSIDDDGFTARYANGSREALAIDSEYAD